MKDDLTVSEICESFINGNFKQMYDQLDQYTLGDFLEDCQHEVCISDQELLSIARMYSNYKEF